METILALPFAVLMYGAIPVYGVWQVLVLFRRRRWALALSLVPVVPMAMVLYATVEGYRASSNLWPLFLILAAPVAVFWLWLVGRILPAR
jgi:hypothetical protein